MRILMLAAENAALPGGKVGGIGDVIRDVPRALASRGLTVSILMPAYGRYAQSAGVRHLASLNVPFGGGTESVDLLRLPGSGDTELLVFDHPLFAVGGDGAIYCDDPPHRPFARDASKFALFCASAAEALLTDEVARPDVVHLHDWHAATLAVLLRRYKNYASLSGLPLVYTIHNLALQGIRPLSGDVSSLGAWFPELVPGPDLMDPRYPGCYNPTRAAIRLCDRVHTVSPSYAREVCDPDLGFGEGLQKDLAEAQKEGRLHGILNGCDYSDAGGEALPFAGVLDLAREQLLRWIGVTRDVRSAHLLALERVTQWQQTQFSPKRMLTLVSRLTEQKIGLLAQLQDDGRSTLVHLLDQLREDECLIALGNGQPDAEQLFTQAQAESNRLLYLCGYSEALSEQLYLGGDLFLMPSRFEPCGIAQMLAMRAGQPCLVNRTGGLADTVEDGVTGFVFDAEDDPARSRAMLKRAKQALTQLRRHRKKQRAMREAAGAARFSWSVVAEQYQALLYDLGRSSLRP